MTATITNDEEVYVRTIATFISAQSIDSDHCAAFPSFCKEIICSKLNSDKVMVSVSYTEGALYQDVPDFVRSRF